MTSPTRTTTPSTANGHHMATITLVDVLATEATTGTATLHILTTYYLRRFALVHADYRGDVTGARGSFPHRRVPSAIQKLLRVTYASRSLRTSEILHAKNNTQYDRAMARMRAAGQRKATLVTEKLSGNVHDAFMAVKISRQDNVGPFRYG